MVVQRLQALAKLVHPFLALASLRTISNAWCTAARFGNADKRCTFKCGEGNDSLRHYFVCQELRVQMNRVFKEAPLAFRDHFPEFLTLSYRGTMSDNELILSAVTSDAILHVLYNSRGNAVEQHVRARLRFTAKQTAGVRSVICHFSSLAQ